MSLSIQTISTFEKLFSGNKEAHGVHIPGGEKDSSGKIRGKSFTKNEIVADKLYKEHLEGKTGLGIIPVDHKSECAFSVIDVDYYGIEKNKEIVETIYKWEIPIVPFRSKSGGLHLYTFYEKYIKAKYAIKYMELFVSILGLEKKTEIFPKQKSLETGQVGSWINLPYFGCDNTDRYMYNEKMEPVSFEDFMLNVHSLIKSTQQINARLDNLPLSDGPPCLQSIYLKGNTDSRNEYLFSLARYYKTKYGDDFEYKIIEANKELKSPIDLERLQRTIINSHKKKDYSYKCANEPIVSICRKELCKLRQYGIGGDEVSNLSFEEMIQYKTDPPYYEWVVNGASLRFYSEIDIIQQQKFRELCFRELHILPIRVKEVNWTAIVNKALENIEIKSINEEEDISPGTLFKEYLHEFLEKRAMAKNKEQILLDRVYKDEEFKQYVFKPKNLVLFLYNQKSFRIYGQTEIQARLKDLGGKPQRYYVSKESGSIRAWTLPFSALEKFIDDEVKKEEINIDFMEDYDEKLF